MEDKEKEEDLSQLTVRAYFEKDESSPCDRGTCIFEEFCSVKNGTPPDRMGDPFCVCYDRDYDDCMVLDYLKTVNYNQAQWEEYYDKLIEKRKVFNE